MKNLLEELKIAERQLWTANEFDTPRDARSAVVKIECYAEEVGASVVWDCGPSCPRYVYQGMSYHGASSLFSFEFNK